MKKFYTILAALAVCLSASAANKLTFYLGDKAIENGSTVEFTDIEIEEDYGDGFCAIKIAPDLYLKNDFYSSKITVNVNSLGGQSVMICAGGLCESGSKVAKACPSMQANTMLNLQFHYEDFETPVDEMPSLTVEFEAVDASGRNESANFTLVMKAPEAGVGSLDAGDRVSYAGGALRYSVSAPAELAVYSIVGSRVLSRTVSGNGSVAFEGLGKGCYIYKLGKHTGKIYVK